MSVEVPNLGNQDSRLYRPTYRVLERRVIEVSDDVPDDGAGGVDETIGIPGPEHFHMMIDPMIPAVHDSPPLNIRFSAETNGTRNGTTL